MNILSIIIATIYWGVEIYVWLILVRALLSFIQPRTYHPIFRFIYDVTEPVLNMCRRVLPVTRSGIDFSPFLAIFGLEMAKAVAVYLLSELSRYLGG